LWYRDIAPLLQTMISSAKYPSDVLEAHMRFFKATVCTSFGPHPDVTAKKPFKSYMNDDHTPIELSWSWKKTLATSGEKVLPKVRYSVEPIGEHAGSKKDVWNQEAPERFLRGLKSSGEVDVDFKLYDYFREAVLNFKASTTVDQSVTEASSQFLAIELAATGKMRTKAYFMPPGKGEAQFHTIVRAVEKYPETGSLLLKALDLVKSAGPSQPGETAPMLAVDCIDPQEARIKIYIRKNATSVSSVIATLETSGSKLGETQRSLLRDIWRSVLSLDHTSISADTDELPLNTHNTAGMIYHFDLRLNSSAPKVKVYIPVKHYGKNDLEVARGLSGWLERNGMGLREGNYLDAVERMCVHRRLEAGRGFQTYVSVAFEGEDVGVTVYLQPEVY
ncbi:aromatic prenyltransferase, partial [Byssothecium circinans]